MVKLPSKNQLLPIGGSTIVPPSGKEYVLDPDELKQLVAAGQKSTAQLTPVKDPAGRPRPWDIEFGFKGGKLWLFQCRPFLGNDELKNIPALAPLEARNATNGARSEERRAGQEWRAKMTQTAENHA